MKIKILLLLVIIMSFFSFQSFANQKEGKISGDLPNLKKYFDHVIITMTGFEEFGDTITTIDTVQAKEGKFEYRFSVPSTRMTTFKLLKNNEIVIELAIKDATTSPQCAYFSEICIGNEDIKISNKYTFWPEDVVYCEGLKENKWYYWFETSGIDFDKVTKDFIIKHPNSFAILQAIYFQRIFLSTKEISEMLDLFSDELKQSATYGKIKNYLDKMLALEKGDYAKNFNWLDINGTSHDFKTILGNKKYVLFIFWSSSCKPCKEDFKTLKSFQEQYADQVSIVKLSIDSDFAKWKEAVEEEKMPWYNLSGLPNSKETIKEVYHIDELPDFILLDSEGKPAIKEVIDYFYPIEEFFNYSPKPVK